MIAAAPTLGEAPLCYLTRSSGITGFVSISWWAVVLPFASDYRQGLWPLPVKTGTAPAPVRSVVR